MAVTSEKFNGKDRHRVPWQQLARSKERGGLSMEEINELKHQG